MKKKGKEKINMFEILGCKLYDKYNIIVWCRCCRVSVCDGEVREGYVEKEKYCWGFVIINKHFYIIIMSRVFE